MLELFTIIHLWILFVAAEMMLTSHGEKLSDLRKRAWAWCTGWPIEIIEKITPEDSQDGEETDEKVGD